MTWAKIGRLSLLASIAIALAGCEEGGGKPGGSEAPANSVHAQLGKRDIEAPKVFQVTDSGLWDGRPSLGGVWIAHPTVKDPHRVIIRNEANGKSTVGALFRRERETPGPKLQVSSDAAEKLGMLAGQPVKLNVTALIREEVKEAPTLEVDAVISDEAPTKPGEAAAKPPKPPARTKPLSAPGEIQQTTLDPIASAAAAIDAADGGQDANATTPVDKPVRTPKPLFALTKPYIQAATFSDKGEATKAADTLREAGLEPAIKEQGDASSWRVLVGPATNRKQRTALAKQIKGLGFADAHFVKE